MPETQDLTANRLFSVEGYVCLVTGAGSSAGLMCAQALAANGARVYITDHNSEVLETVSKVHSPKYGPGKITSLGHYDLASHSSLTALVTSLSRLESRLNLLVCTVGKLNSIPAIPPFLPLLQSADGSGNVIIIPHFTAQESSKAGIIHLTKILAMSGEFRDKGVRVNSIALEGLEGEGMEVKGSGGGEKREESGLPEEMVSSGQTDEHVDQLGEAGSGGEMAMACLFLARNRFVTGEVIRVSG